MGCGASSEPTKEGDIVLKPVGGIPVIRSNSTEGTTVANDETSENNETKVHSKEGHLIGLGNANEDITSADQSVQNVGNIPQSSNQDTKENVGLYLKERSSKDESSVQKPTSEGGHNLKIDDDVTKALLQTNRSQKNLKADDNEEDKNLEGNLTELPSENIEHSPDTHGLSNSNQESDREPELESHKEKEKEMMDEQNIAQSDFHTAIRCSCSLLDPESLYKFANDQVTFFQLNRALPYNHSLSHLLSRLPNLQELDLSGNSMGPQPFRLLMLVLARNSSITWLNMANNMTDTDTAESIGVMLSKNRSLLYLDVSGNYLGKDYFSRCVGPAIVENDCLMVLRCEGIGSTDFTVLIENLKKNTTLQELNISHNQLAEPQKFIPHLVEMLSNKDSRLSCLEMRNCNLGEEEMVAITTALATNETITYLNLASNSVTSNKTLLKLMWICLKHKVMMSLNLDDTRVTHPTDDKIEFERRLTSPSPMESLSLANCSLSNTHLESLLSHIEDSAVGNLQNLNLSNNQNVTVATLAPDVSSCLYGLKRLNLGLNDCQSVEQLHNCNPNMKLNYLNLRKAKIKYETIHDLHRIFDPQEEATLVLDGIRFSGSGMKSLKDLLANFSNVSALSLGGCCLSDGDTQLLCDVITSPGLPLHMLKLAANRISEKGVNALVDALVSHKSHPLKLVDLSDNQITSKGANKLCELFKHTTHRSQIHSLNVSRNNIDAVGLKALASVIGQFSITCLHLNNQSATFREEEVDEVCEIVAQGLGLQITKTDDNVTPGSSNLGSLPPSGFLVKLNGLSGESGPIGKHLDSLAICTDYSRQRLPYSSMQQMTDVAAYLLAKDKCELTSDEWDLVINAKKEFPQWLKVSENWERTVFLSHLPASVTVQKMEGVFENEVDCNVTEVYLLKDPISRKNNGFAWALLESKNDVEKAIDYMNTGQAQLYSQPYIISRLNISVKSDSTTVADSAAKSEIASRKAKRRREEEEHNALLRKSYLESQERHAYRLAHPAYADGRIW